MCFLEQEECDNMIRSRGIW